MLVQKNLPIIDRSMMNGKILIGSDFHVPFQDKAAVDCFIDHAIETQPEAIVIAGDLLDFYRLSKYVKAAGKDPKTEIEEGKIILQSLREGCPYSDIYYTIGNHESRLENYVYTKAPDVEGLIDSFYDMLDCPKLHVKPCHRVNFNNEFVVKHGDLVSQKAGQTAIKELQSMMMSGASGHTHRLVKIIHRANGKKYYYLETGCLCSMNPHYKLLPDWQQGFGEVIFEDYNLVFADVKEIESGRILY